MSLKGLESTMWVTDPKWMCDIISLCQTRPKTTAADVLSNVPPETPIWQTAELDRALQASMDTAQVFLAVFLCIIYNVIYCCHSNGVHVTRQLMLITHYTFLLLSLPPRRGLGGHRIRGHVSLSVSQLVCLSIWKL